MATHRLKTWPISFQPMKSGVKTFDMRKNDRNFQVGDILCLEEWDPETQKYVGGEGDELYFKVKWILESGWFRGLEKGYVIMSLERHDGGC